MATYFQTCVRWPRASRASRPWRSAAGTWPTGSVSWGRVVYRPTAWQTSRQSSRELWSYWSYSTGLTGRPELLQYNTSPMSRLDKLFHPRSEKTCNQRATPRNKTDFIYNNALLYIAAQCWIVHKTLKHWNNNIHYFTLQNHRAPVTQN